MWSRGCLTVSRTAIPTSRAPPPLPIRPAAKATWSAPPSTPVSKVTAPVECADVRPQHAYVLMLVLVLVCSVQLRSAPSRSCYPRHGSPCGLLPTPLLRPCSHPDDQWWHGAGHPHAQVRTHRSSPVPACCRFRMLRLICCFPILPHSGEWQRWQVLYAGKPPSLLVHSCMAAAAASSVCTARPANGGAWNQN